MKLIYLLFVIISLGFFLRVFQLDKLPLYGDELTMAYDSYSLLKTGHDQTGQFLPLTFSMGAGRPGGYVYASIPFFAIFGLSEISVRILSSLSGVLFILLIFCLGKQFFSEKVGLAAAFLASISPWSLNLSRAGYEAHFALILVLLGVYFFLRLKKNLWYLTAVAICFGLAIHTYPTFKLTLPLFAVLICYYIQSKELLSKDRLFPKISAGIIIVIFIILSIRQTTSSGSEVRFKSINLFSNPTNWQMTIQKINFERNVESLPPQLAVFFHNRIIEYGYKYFINYIRNLSTDFLFLRGDLNPRHNMSTMGGFYLAEAFLIFIGIGTLVLSKKLRLLSFLVMWILIAPLATALIEDPHFLRSSFLLPPLLLLSGSGFISLISLKSNKYLVSFVCLAIFIQFLFLIDRIYFVAPRAFSRFWAYPAKKASEIAIKQKAKYNFVLLSDKVDNLEFAFPFYAKIDPREVLENNLQKVKLQDFMFKKYGNVYFGYIPEASVKEFVNSLPGSVLYIGSPDAGKNTVGFDVYMGDDNLPALAVFEKPSKLP